MEKPNTYEVVGEERQESEGVDGEEKVEGNAKWETH
jgi:hypothetical protein